MKETRGRNEGEMRGIEGETSRRNEREQKEITKEGRI